MFGSLIAILTRRKYETKRNWLLLFGASMLMIAAFALFIPKTDSQNTQAKPAPQPLPKVVAASSGASLLPDRTTAAVISLCKAIMTKKIDGIYTANGHAYLYKKMIKKDKKNYAILIHFYKAINLDNSKDFALTTLDILKFFYGSNLIINTTPHPIYGKNEKILGFYLLDINNYKYMIVTLTQDGKIINLNEKTTDPLSNLIIEKIKS